MNPSSPLFSPAPVPIFADDLTGVFNWKLLELIRQQARLSDFADLSPELEARLKNHALEFASFSGRIEQLKTKQYTYTRISAPCCICCLVLRSKSFSLRSRLITFLTGASGFRRSAGPLLRRIKETCRLPLITKTADAGKVLDEGGLQQLHMDFFASHLYQSLVFQKSGVQMKNEYTRSVIIQD